MDEAAARQVVLAALGEEAVALRHQPFGHHSVTYEAVLAGCSVMLHMHREATTFAGTAHNLAVLGGLGLPVPKLLRVDTSLSEFPFAYTILERIEGRDLRYELPAMTEAQVEVLAEQVVGFQRAVATLPTGDGYGFVPIGATGPHRSWTALVEADQQPWPETATAGLGDRLRALFERYRPELDAIPATCFLDDVTTKNVIVHEGVLQGIVDLDTVCYGDPMYMLGLTATAIVADLEASQLRYVEALRRAWRLTEEEYGRACFYSALMGMDFLRKFGADAPAWAARMESAIEGWMRRADAGV
jgi:aminoglycoside phosphotransferase (APT) family kinase protein